MNEPRRAVPPPSKRAQLVAALCVVALLGLAGAWLERDELAIALGLHSARQQLWTRVEPASTHEYIRDTDTIQVAIRNLARLETVSYHMERVIDLKDERTRAFGMLKAQDAILLVAAGDVVAGVDLAKLAPGDMQVQPEQRRVQLRLPPAEILSVTLDEERTYVHSRRTTLLTKPAADLETRARQHAQDAIREAALETGILERARQTATQTLRALLGSLGYEVDFFAHE